MPDIRTLARLAASLAASGLLAAHVRAEAPAARPAASALRLGLGALVPVEPLRRVSAGALLPAEPLRLAAPEARPVRRDATINARVLGTTSDLGGARRMRGPCTVLLPYAARLAERLGVFAHLLLSQPPRAAAAGGEVPAGLVLGRRLP